MSLLQEFGYKFMLGVGISALILAVLFGVVFLELYRRLRGFELPCPVQSIDKPVEMSEIEREDVREVVGESIENDILGDIDLGLELMDCLNEITVRYDRLIAAAVTDDVAKQLQLVKSQKQREKIKEYNDLI